MPTSVERLKELLFDDEAQALHKLAKRVDSIADIDTRGREELRQQLEQVFSRAGTQERLTVSVAEILDEALRRAEVSQHSDLSRAIAPLVVTTIKSELRNSQDEMVEALYPITGRLVKSYVASAMKDLADQMNRRLEQNPVMLRLQSLTTGRSVAELALAGTQDFTIRELYLIRRGSGELVAHWPDTPMSGREQTMSGVLAAINEFANEAFAADQASLRHIDLGDADVYLRGSPLYLLAARCSGTAPVTVEETIDDAFLVAVEKQHQIEQHAEPGTDLSRRRASALADVGQALETGIAAAKAASQNPAGGGRGLTILSTLVLLPLIAWFAASWYVQFAESRVRDKAERTIALIPGMQGYPTQVEVASLGRKVTVSGLVPSQDTETEIVRRLTTEMPGADIRNRLTIVAGSGIVIPEIPEIPDLSPEFTSIRRDVTELGTSVSRQAMLRTSDRAAERLRQAARDLDRAAKDMTNAERSAKLSREAGSIETIISDLKLRRADLAAWRDTAPPAKLAAVFGDLSRQVETTGNGIVAPPGVALPPPAKATAAGPLDIEIERLAAESERLAGFAASLSVAALMQTPPVQPTSRQRLERFVREKAIFFASDTGYRDVTASTRVLEDLAGLIKSTDALVRIVGYTDEAGGQLRNVPLAQQRAEKVRQDLLALGTPPARLVAVGRANALDVSVSKGAFSPNRRVEFEIGFDGETQP